MTFTHAYMFLLGTKYVYNENKMQGTMSGEELRTRVRRLGLTYARAAELLGLSRDGLNKQMRGNCKVSRQTEIILDGLERDMRDNANIRRWRGGAL